MKTLFTVLALGLAFQAGAQTVQLDNPVFKCVFPLEAEGKPISVITGHAAPFIYDYNKDGVDDLLVGEFGEVDFDGVEEGVSHEYVQGRCRIYINHGTNAAPVYKDFEYLSAQGEPMKVPVTCCISFVPRFVDMDADGIDDVISGSYTGEVYFWKGLGKNEFQKSMILKDKDGVPINADISMTADPVDWDADGDYDLLLSTRSSGAFLVRNTGSAAQFRFEKAEQLPLEKYLPRKLPTHFLPYDWNGDGLFDLICGCEDGDLVFYANTGTKGNPAFGTPQILWSNPSYDELSDKAHPIGSRIKLWVYDYDHDGKEDLLAGDVNDISIKIRELSRKEQVYKKKLELQIAEISKKFAKAHPDLQARFEKKDYPIEHKEYIDFVMARSAVQTKLYKIQRSYCRHETLGYVWVFIRK